MADTFKRGDVVQLKSGGPIMTVQEPADGGKVLCVWFPTDESDRSFSNVFFPEMLKAFRSE